MDNQAIKLYNEGYYYYTASNGYPLNYKRAYEYFQQAAALGYGDAINYLGCMHLEGKGVEKDIAMAIDWFEKGVQAQNHWAMYNLGRLYVEGNGVKKDEQLALSLFQQSYNVGKKPDAAYFVGCDLMEKGKYLEAAQLFELAANKANVPGAWHNLGVLFMNEKIHRKGIPSYASAWSCFSKAADLDLVESMYECGKLMIRIKREDEASMWLSRAAKAGHEPSKKLLKMINFSRYGFAGLFP